jgi:hypothetical protein
VDATACSRSTWATATISRATFAGLSDARSAVNFNRSALRTTVAAKNATFKKLRKRMRDLIKELDFLMARDDPRRRRFGLRRACGRKRFRTRWCR